MPFTPGRAHRYAHCFFWALTQLTGFVLQPVIPVTEIEVRPRRVIPV